MKAFLRFGFVFALVMVLPAFGDSKWGPAGCPAQGPVGPAAAEDRFDASKGPSILQGCVLYHWVVRKDETGLTRGFLYANGKLVGAYDFGEENGEPYYRPWSRADDWGAKTNPPVAPPVSNSPAKTKCPDGVCPVPEREKAPAPKAASQGREQPLADLEPWKIAGVMEEHIGGREMFNLCGKFVTPCRAYQAVDSSLVDDSDKLFLVVASNDKSARDRVMKDYLASEQLTDLRARTNVWSQPFDHWSMVDHRTGQSLFKPKGQMLVMLQDKDGRVLHRQDDYNGPGDLGALRKADPKYDPTKDPDLRKTPAPGVPDSLSGIVDWAKKNALPLGLAAAILGGFLLIRKLPKPAV